MFRQMTAKTFLRFIRHGILGSRVEKGLKRRPGRKWQEMAAIGFPRIRSEIPHERQKIQVGKVTPATPTIGVSRVFESFEMGSQGRLWESTRSKMGSERRLWGQRGSRQSHTTIQSIE